MKQSFELIFNIKMKFQINLFVLKLINPLPKHKRLRKLDGEILLAHPLVTFSWKNLDSC